jgi:hypothetical protein
MTSTERRFLKYLAIGKKTTLGNLLTGAGHIKVDRHTSIAHRWSFTPLLPLVGRKKVIGISGSVYYQGSRYFRIGLTGARKINAGDVFFLFPGVCIVLNPTKRRLGWILGGIWWWTDQALPGPWIPCPDNPVITVGIQEEIAENYLKITGLLEKKSPVSIYCFRHSASDPRQILLPGNIFCLKARPWKANQASQVTDPGKPSPNISQESLAESIGMGYSLYRKKFNSTRAFLRPGITSSYGSAKPRTYWSPPVNPWKK